MHGAVLLLPPTCLRGTVKEHFTFAYIRNALNNKAQLLFYVQDEKP